VQWPAAGSFCVVALLGCAADAPAPALPPATGADVPVQLEARRDAARSPTPAAEATSAPSSDPSAGRDACATVCGHAKTRGCSDGGGCVEACAEMVAIDVCQAPMRAFMACLVTQPAAHFDCDEGGVPQIRDGYCDHEQAAVASCLSQ
jgi:hypothetical protein